MRSPLPSRGFGALLACLLLLVTPRIARAQQSPAAPVQRDTSAAAVVRGYLQAYNAHDTEAIVALLSPEFVWLSITGDSTTIEARGIAAIRAQLESYFRSLPTARSEVEELTVLGPWVSAREHAHWVSASGPRSQASLSVYEVRAGLLRRVWYYPVVRATVTPAAAAQRPD